MNETERLASDLLGTFVVWPILVFGAVLAVPAVFFTLGFGVAYLFNKIAG